MIWEMLLGAALEAALGVLAEAGFGDEVRDLKARLSQKTAKARREAFDRAYRQAVAAAGEARLEPLLEHPPFQEGVITGLLDLEQGFDLQAVAETWEARLPSSQQRALRRFFSALENALMADDDWGLLLARFQDLRFRQDVSAALQARGLDTPTARLVKQVRAQLQGDGAIAQDHSVAAGVGGVAVGGDVGGDAVAGDKPVGADQRGQRVGTQTNVLHASGSVLSGTFHIYQQASGKPKLSEEAFARVLDDYLTWVWSEYRFACLHGLQTLQGTGPHRKPLAAVYTSLRVSQRPAVEPGGHRLEQKDPEGLETGQVSEGQVVDMAELLTLGRRVAIIGGAGCGKTTYLAFVAASLAAALGGQPLDARLKPSRPEAPLPIPLLAPLRFWNVYRREVEACPGERLHRPERGSLKDFMLWYLCRGYKNFEAAEDFFERLLRGGGGLLMFDGMDEVVSREERLVVRDAISRLFNRPPYQDNLCLVTAREAGHRDAPFGSDFVRCDVQPMDEAQIADLVDAWCRDIPKLAVARDRILRVVAELNQARRGQNQEPLVSTPLMVTMIVSVYYSKKELPRERAKLYDAVTDVILQSQYSEADEAGARRQVVTWGAQLPPGKQREWLSLLAFLMHQAGDQGALVDEAQVRRLLAPPLKERGELDRLDAFLAQARGRGGLFEERGERFQFMHLTFQEYLAGQHLASQWRDEAERLAEWVSDGWWRETLLLTLGSLDHPRPFQERSDFVKQLLQLDAPPEAQMAAVELVATGLLELSQPEETLLAQTRARLVNLLGDPGLTGVSGVTRAAAGRALAVLGDPRPGVGVDLETGWPDFVWCEVPAGPFLMGSEDYDDEKPPHTLTLPAFKMGQYPVTNSQYRPFIEAGGYEERRYWTAEGWARKERGGWTAPGESGAPFNLDNHPVVKVSWYEVVAYCRWLTEVWQAAGRIGQDEAVRLPSEAEWEKAARGIDGRRYPWGDEADLARANYDETGIGSTSAVGCFPNGASPCGCLDMAGNVWEWVSSLYKGYPYEASDGREDLEAEGRRVLRGGAFSNTDYNTRCADRNYLDAVRGYDLVGVRVVVSSIPPAL